MSPYQDMLNRRAEVKRQGLALHQAAEADGRGLTPEEQARDDGIFAQIEALDTQIAAMEIERETERARIHRQGVYGTASVPAVFSGMHIRAEDDPRGGWANLGEMALAVMAASRQGGGAFVDPRLHYGAAPSGELREFGATSGEGYLVPQEFRAGIWDVVFDDPFIDLFTFEPTSTGQVELNADETTPWGTSGVLAYWRAERAQMTASRPTNAHRMTRTYQLYAFILATNELMRDVPLLNDRITNKAAAAITWKLAEAFMRGTGVGQPLGLLTATAKIEVSKETSQVADTVVAENVLKMYSRLLRGNGGRPFWVINPDVIPELPTMSIAQQPVWLPPNGLIGTPLGILLGAPIYESEHCDTVGDVGDIVLVNPAGYHAIRRTDAPEFASSIHLYFDYNETAFRWTFEVGGQPFLSNVITPPYSSLTRAHVVTLAARA